MKKEELKQLLSEILKDYEDTVDERNENRRPGMGDTKTYPSLEGFAYWLRNGWLS